MDVSEESIYCGREFVGESGCEIETSDVGEEKSWASFKKDKDMIKEGVKVQEKKIL
jgi:hypothetical protein